MPNKRPSKCYRKLDRPANTRKEFIKRLPDLPEGLRKFTFGNKSKFDFPAKVNLVCLKDIQIGGKSLEAVRVTVNRELKILGEDNYRLQIKSIPFHIARSHGLIGVAKAERLAKGMRLSFGRSMRRFARVKKGKVLIEVLINDDAISYGICKRALVRGTKKLPSKWQIKTEGISLANLQANPKLPKRIKTKKSSGGRTIVLRDV